MFAPAVWPLVASSDTVWFNILVQLKVLHSLVWQHKWIDLSYSMLYVQGGLCGPTSLRGSVDLNYTYWVVNPHSLELCEVSHVYGSHICLQSVFAVDYSIPLGMVEGHVVYLDKIIFHKVVGPIVVLCFSTHNIHCLGFQNDNASFHSQVSHDFNYPEF